GITETTVHVSYRELRREELPLLGGSVIGRPIADLGLWILDRAGSPSPAGVPGELYVSGAGLARGYLNRPELTAERFVPHPFAAVPGERLYRTGDLVRLLPDGNLVFAGRTDSQVKLRGFRIELGEVEAVLSRHPSVRDAVVLVRDQALVAYVTPREAPLSADALRSDLQRQLPAYL